MNRRALLTTWPAAAVLVGADATGWTIAGPEMQASVPGRPGDDAELVRLCAAFDVLERKVQAAFSGNVTAADEDRADAVRAAVSDEQAPILDAITARQPSTLAGFQALAGSLALWDCELLKGDPMEGCTDDRLTLALVRSLLGQPPAAVPIPDPDAELLALCAAFRRQHEMSYDEGNPEWEAAADARQAVTNEIEGLVPTTEAGHRAKAAIAVVLLDENRIDGEFAGDSEDQFALAMLRGWLGVA